jgi:tRNA-2-methylthio-N6-dimethylallyladenosine synthase
MDILVERPGGREGQMAGRSPYMQAVNFQGNEDQIGDIVSCVITQAKQKSVSGELDNLKGAA